VERLGPLAAGVRAAARQQQQQQRRLHHEMRPPWNADAVRSSRSSQGHQGEGCPPGALNGGTAQWPAADQDAAPGGGETLGLEGDDEEAQLQRALELSLQEVRARVVDPGQGGGVGGVAEPGKEGGSGVNGEEEELARAIAESMRMHAQEEQLGSSRAAPASGAAAALTESSAPPVQLCSAQEAQALSEGAVRVQRALADAAGALPHGADGAAQTPAVGEPALPVSVPSPPLGAGPDTGVDREEQPR